MAGGIGPQLGTGLGSQQQPNATGSANNVEQQVVSPNRGGDNVAQASQAAASGSEAAVEAVQIAERPRTRKLTSEDLNKTLLQNGIQPSTETKEMASLMMKYGVELSRENFDQLLKLTSGRRDSSSMESAIIAKSKGLPESSVMDGVKGLLFDQQHIASQAKAFQDVVQNFSKSINSFKNLDSSLMSGLSALMNEFSDELKKLIKKDAQLGTQLAGFRRGGLTKDLFSLMMLFQGVESKYVGDKRYNAFLKDVANMKQSTQRLLSNLMAQQVISKSAKTQLADVMENFAFWQIPNLMAKNPEDSKIDILIKKEGKRKKETINPKKTKIILNIETPDLGVVTIILTIIDNKIWYVFNSENEATVKHLATLQNDLKERMETKQYVLAGFQTIKKRVDIKKYMLPTFDLDAIKRIDAEI